MWATDSPWRDMACLAISANCPFNYSSATRSSTRHSARMVAECRAQPASRSGCAALSLNRRDLHHGNTWCRRPFFLMLQGGSLVMIVSRILSMPRLLLSTLKRPKSSGSSAARATPRATWHAELFTRAANACTLLATLAVKEPPLRDGFVFAAALG